MIIKSRLISHLFNSFFDHPIYSHIRIFIWITPIIIYHIIIYYMDNHIIDLFVSNVINKQFSTSILYSNSREIIEQNKNDVILEKKREFNNVMTELIIYEFFKTSEQIYNFVKIVYESFDKAIKNYT